MRAVGIKILKNRLSEYVRLAAGGETILVTDREKVVAELIPPRPERPLAAGDAIRAEGIRQGWLTPRQIPPGTPLPTGTGSQPFAKVMAELEKSREDR